MPYSLSVRSKWSSGTRFTPGSPLPLFSLWAVGSLKARGSLETTNMVSSQSAPSRADRLHTLNIKGQQTHNLSFRSGFSFEPWDTRVSLNAHGGRGVGVSWSEEWWQWPDLLHHSTQIKVSGDDILMFLWAREVQ